jgi:hypothetical protein
LPCATLTAAICFVDRVARIFSSTYFSAKEVRSADTYGLPAMEIFSLVGRCCQYKDVVMLPSFAVGRFSVRAVALASVLFVIGCQQPLVGAICSIGSAANQSSSVLATPSLDCQSRECLKVPQQTASLPAGAQALGPTNGMCTAACESDSDCEAQSGTPCQTGFACGVPSGLTVGDSCCQKVCVCRDYVKIPAGGTMPVPEACNADNPDATCCNLPGRSGNVAYPSCR